MADFTVITGCIYLSLCILGLAAKLDPRIDVDAWSAPVMGITCALVAVFIL